MFVDRVEAGKRVGDRLINYQGVQGLVIGLSRGGVVVAQVVAKKLSLPWDVLVVKKISSPSDAELAIGAVAPDEVSIIDDELSRVAGLEGQRLGEVIKEKSALVTQKMQLYRKGRLPLVVKDKTIIVVDDGAATGATIAAAVLWLKAKHARKIIVALPVAPPDVVKKLAPQVDELVVLATPNDFGSVGQFYKHFDQVEDEDVVKLLS